MDDDEKETDGWILLFFKGKTTLSVSIAVSGLMCVNECIGKGLGSVYVEQNLEDYFTKKFYFFVFSGLHV